MPIPLPNLDDRTWEDLVEEGLSRIPALAPTWTDHNPSDPGITLIELFAYFTEALIYRTNRVSKRHQRSFLRLINGPAFKSAEAALDEDLRAAIARLPEIYRAVSALDYEVLASRVHGVGRAHCLPQRNLSSSHPDAAATEAAGHVSVLVVPQATADPAQLLEKVREALEPARLLGTRLHVGSPRFVTVTVRATLQISPGVSPDEVRRKAVESLAQYFDPLGGGPAGGWPLGRSVYVSEVCQALQRVAGVVVARKTVETLTRRPVDFLAVDPSETARLRYNRLQELEAVELRPDELVQIAVDGELFRV